MALRIPRFDRTIPLVDEKGCPTLAFHQWWEKAAQAIESAFTGLSENVEAIQAALDAAAAANAAASVAQTAADGAVLAADNAAAATKITSSGTSGVTITATDAGANVTVTVTAHNRLYGDGTSVAVDGGSVVGLNYSTLYYIYYDKPDFTGSPIVYNATTSMTTAAQTGVRHLVGSVTTPAALGAPVDGNYVYPPGVGYLPL